MSASLVGSEMCIRDRPLVSLPERCFLCCGILAQIGATAEQVREFADAQTVARPSVAFPARGLPAWRRAEIVA
eukprot:444038-Alexandrium_andersonii.AAC.1